MARQPLAEPLHRWSISDAVETYSIDRWSGGFFSVNSAGHITVRPSLEDGHTIDLKELVDEIRDRGIRPPLLLRFSDILRSRIELLNNAFANAIRECEYHGDYRGVFPIKVNQSRTVVEEVVEFGRPFHHGLEAGSKPELMATVALLSDPNALIICNGYKDDEYVKTALLASKLGPTVILVVEKLSELRHIHQMGLELGIRPKLGIRARLSTPGAGRWQQSGGDLSKFGLSAAEILEGVHLLKEWGEIDCLRLLHFHLGSQISAIRSIKNALREGGRLYVELRKLGCEKLSYLDVGGGLGVDYDGSQTNFQSSINYTVQEYANDVVYGVQEVCEAGGAPHPTLISESGRATAAHHSVLIVDVLEVSHAAQAQTVETLPDDIPPIVENMGEVLESVRRKNILESFHDAVAYRDQALQLFNLGHMSLEHRVLCDRLHWAICKKIAGLIKDLSHVPEELDGLERTLSDTYFLNFSMFQSLPDAWAVGQLFPIVPIHRLDEEPTRRAVLADITCDSDGCISQFIDLRDVKKVLEVHAPDEDNLYLLGIFLVGAYQEILGDMHNLFGDTNTVHVGLDEDGRYRIRDVQGGDTLSDVLRYVNYSPQGLIRRLRENIEVALRESRMTFEESRKLMDCYRSGLEGSTYLQRD